MKKESTKPTLTLLFSLGYWFGAHSLGLLLHPYQSMRRIVRDDFYRPLVGLPLVCLLGWWIAGFIIARFNVLATLRLSLVAKAIDTISLKQFVFAILFLWGGVFLLLWQVILLYLYSRFQRAIGGTHAKPKE